MSNTANFDRLAEEYDADVRCSTCRQRRTRRGCQCDLDRLYNDDHAAVLAWWDSLPDDVRNPKRGVKPLYAVLSTMSAAQRRTGLNDRPTRGSDRQTEADLEKQSLQDHLGLEPKWRAPKERPKPPYRPSAGKPGTTVLPRYIER